MSRDNNKKIDYSFSNPALFRLAMTHRSAGRDNNERLEFLGDSILGFMIADILYQRFPDASEGELSRLRAGLVKKSTLADVARELELGSHLTLGSGELKSGGAKRESILADAVEALISAVYLDSDMATCRNKILQWFGPRIDSLEQASRLPDKDAKTSLQEFLQARQRALPVYTLQAVRGREHEQVFVVECRTEVLSEVVSAEGTSRREAEQAAARKVLARLQAEH